MATRRGSLAEASSKPLGQSLSWMALLAGTTLGADTVVSLRAEVRGSVDLREAAAEGCRLVVQSYSRAAWPSGAIPGRSVRPLGAVQRAVSLGELREGVQVEILQVGAEEVLQLGSVLVAWVEPGAANLAFDGLSARPGPEAVVAMSVAGGGGGSTGARLMVGGDRVA